VETNDETKADEIVEAPEPSADAEPVSPSASAASPSPDESSTAEVDFGSFEDWDEDAAYTTLAASEVKSCLLDSFVGTDRGFSANSDARAEINELITQLESANPTDSPNEELDKLSGTWRLAYTSNSELFLLLAATKLPLVKVGEITQIIDGSDGSVENQLEFITPLAKGSLSATASFEVRSPKRLQVKFTESRIGTPKLVTDLPIPSSVEIAGQAVDLTPLQGAADQVRNLLRPAAELLAKQPDLKLPIPDNDNGTSWLLTTYLDDDLRIARGDGGSVFVLEKVVAV